MLERFVREEHLAWDMGTHREVILDDCYRLADRTFGPDDVIIDIGANVGFFSGLVLEKGAGLVLAVEPSPDNYGALARNLYPYGTRKHTFNRAVWRSDIPATVLHLHEFPPDGNTGGVSVLEDNGEHAVLSLPLDDLIGDYVITYLKVDCEGSEYPILFTSRKLLQVKEIAIECHPIEHMIRPCDNVKPGCNTPQGLAEHLAHHGFTVAVEARHGMPDGWAYIWAQRL